MVVLSCIGRLGASLSHVCCRALHSQERYLGKEKTKRTIRRMNEKKFVFDWEAVEDTSQDVNPLYANKHQTKILVWWLERTCACHGLRNRQLGCAVLCLIAILVRCITAVSLTPCA